MTMLSASDHSVDVIEMLEASQMVHLEVMYVSKDFLKHFCVLKGKKKGVG